VIVDDQNAHGHRVIVTHSRCRNHRAALDLASGLALTVPAAAATFAVL
jgi:hypothetical protein